MRGDRLRQVRETQGISQRELAKICNLGESMVYRYENELSDPSAEVLKLLANTLGVSTDYLLGMTNNPRGQLGDSELSEEERDIVDKYRGEGWPGVIRLSADKFAKT